MTPTDLPSDESIRCVVKNEFNAPHYVDLWKSLFGAENLDKRIRYWEWLYCLNPYAQSGNELPVYVYWVGDRPVGQIGVMPAKVIWNGNLLNAGWCIDMFILKEFRRRGIGSSLFSAVHSCYPILLSLGQTNQSMGTLQKAKWHRCDPLMRYFKLLKPLRTIPKKVLVKYSCRNTAQRLFPSRPRQAPYDDAHAMPKGFAEADLTLLQNERLSQKTRIWRDIDFLVWRYEKHPFFSYEIERFKLGAGKEAYAVWRLAQRGLFYHAILQELLYSSDVDTSDLNMILKHVADKAEKCGAEVFECQTSDKQVLASLPGGVVSRETGVYFYYRTMFDETSVIYPTDEWRLFAGDCDVDLIPGFQ